MSSLQEVDTLVINNMRSQQLFQQHWEVGDSPYQQYEYWKLSLSTPWGVSDSLYQQYKYWQLSLSTTWGAGDSPYHQYRESTLRIVDSGVSIFLANIFTN
jgi:hypothetical protein